MESFGVFLVSITMLFGSYVAGCLPLFFTLNERRIRLTSIFGAGILIGTTLCVIIPEGISAFYETSSHLEHKTSNTSKQSVVSSENWRESLDRIRLKLDDAVRENSALRRELDELISATNALSKRMNCDTSANDSQPRRRMRREAGANVATTPERRDAGGAIGLALIIGFLFLFAVDHFSKAHAAGRNRSVPTLALIIHAAADGIAMGSASTTYNSAMPMITFFAIMIHKAPAAFALVSFLLLEGLEKFRIRLHLMAFSLSTPLATIITYTLLRNMESATPSSTSTGLILLFSGGTFLYIAASHVLPELVWPVVLSQISIGANEFVLLDRIRWDPNFCAHFYETETKASIKFGSDTTPTDSIQLNLDSNGSDAKQDAPNGANLNLTQNTRPLMHQIRESKYSPAISGIPINGGTIRPHFSLGESVLFTFAALLPSFLAAHHSH